MKKCQFCGKELTPFTFDGKPLSKSNFERKQFCSRICSMKNYDKHRRKRDKEAIIWGDQTKNIDIYLRIPLC